jgi:hypothetical protein
MTLEERAMQTFGEHFEGLDAMTQESIRGDCILAASRKTLEMLKELTAQFGYGWPSVYKKRALAIIDEAEGRA